MGLFDWLFGSGSKPEPEPQKLPEPVAVTKVEAVDIQPETVGASAQSDGLNPEIVAAIAASIQCVMDTSVNAEIMAAITAAVVHHSGGGVRAVRMKPGRSAWALAGRQKLMDARQFA